MLSFKNLNIDDKCVLDKFLYPYTFNTCEYSFTTLYIWRKALDIKYAIIYDTLIIKKKDFNNDEYFMQPIGFNQNNLDKIIKILLAEKESSHMKFLFKDIETPFMELLSSKYSNLIIEEDLDNFDYIYLSEKLASLSGKKFHGKKNHYNNFIKNNDYKVEALTPKHCSECITIAEKWLQNKNKLYPNLVYNNYLNYELKGIKDLITNMNILNLEGIVIYLNDELSAFTLGEKLNNETAIIHIEKANPNVNGLYTFVNKTFIENCFNDVKYINREQDMGIEGLRKSKLSYKPLKLEPKYSINFIK